MALAPRLGVRTGWRSRAGTPDSCRSSIAGSVRTRALRRSRAPTAPSRIGKSERLPPTTPTSGRSATIAPAELRPGVTGPAEGIVDRGTERRDVAHLPAVEDLVLVIEMEVHVGGLEGRRDPGERCWPPRTLAQQVDHGRGGGPHVGRAERQAADRPQVLLELA